MTKALVAEVATSGGGFDAKSVESRTGRVAEFAKKRWPLWSIQSVAANGEDESEESDEVRVTAEGMPIKWMGDDKNPYKRGTRIREGFDFIKAGTTREALERWCNEKDVGIGWLLKIIKDHGESGIRRGLHWELREDEDSGDIRMEMLPREATAAGEKKDEGGQEVQKVQEG